VVARQLRAQGRGGRHARALAQRRVPALPDAAGQLSRRPGVAGATGGGGDESEEEAAEQSTGVAHARPSSKGRARRTPVFSGSFGAGFSSRRGLPENPTRGDGSGGRPAARAARPARRRPDRVRQQRVRPGGERARWIGACGIFSPSSPSSRCGSPCSAGSCRASASPPERSPTRAGRRARATATARPTAANAARSAPAARPARPARGRGRGRRRSPAPPSCRGR